MNNDIVDKFSTHLKTVLTRALCFVVEQNLSAIEPEHLLWALGTQKGCIGSELLHKAEIKPDALKKLIGGARLKSTEVAPGSELSHQLSENAKRVLEKAVLTANIYGHRYIGTEHLLSGLLQINDARTEQFFLEETTDMVELKNQVALVLKSTSKFPDLADSVQSATAEETKQEAMVKQEEKDTRKTPALDYFGRELTTAEAESSIDPVIGRDGEIQRLMEILARRTKNNPLLLGEPGVGKTAIVEGLAKHIVAGDVPVSLQNKRIIALDMAMVIAGTMYRGEFEARLRQLIEELKDRPEIILFIDEIHTIVGTGAASGSLDAANMLKPALARGEIRCIGATTQAEFKKHIESDSALERRFQTIAVHEPSKEEAIEILRGVAPHYERFHGVTILPEAIEEAVELSNRYIQDKHLPDKALDLLDEAAASLRVQSQSPGPAEEKRLLKHRLQALREEKRQAVVEERFLDAVGLKEEEERLNTSLLSTATEYTGPELTLTGREIAGIIARITKIPLGDLLREKLDGLQNLEEHLSKSVLGQEQAIRTAASAIRRARTGVSHPDRPLASLLFLGPSGVGKTELAKAIAREVFHDEKALIRLDMSEYSEGFTISKLIGAPAGYVGYRESAKLTDALKARPYCVLLFDELEKAHPDVQNLLLQLLEEGEITDATGRKINGKNTFVIMTSNVGLARFRGGGLGFASGNEAKKALLASDLRTELEARFRPELLSRVDHLCIFHPLETLVLAKIVRKELTELSARLEAERFSITFEPELTKHLIEQINPASGARDIRRLIQSHIESPLAERLSKGNVPKSLSIKPKNGKIVVVRNSYGRTGDRHRKTSKRKA